MGSAVSLPPRTCQTAAGVAGPRTAARSPGRHRDREDAVTWGAPESARGKPCRAGVGGTEHDNYGYGGPSFMPAWRRNGQRREPGSSVEVFCRKDTAPQRAQQFYQNQVAGRLTPVMKQFIQRMEMAFIATSDGSGECDSSFRAGPAGFIRGLDDRCARHPGVRAVSATRAATAWGRLSCRTASRCGTQGFLTAQR